MKIIKLLKKIKLPQRNIYLNINLTAKEKILHFYKDNYTFGIDLKKYEIASGYKTKDYSLINIYKINKIKILKIQLDIFSYNIS